MTGPPGRGGGGLRTLLLTLAAAIVIGMVALVLRGRLPIVDISTWLSLSPPPGQAGPAVWLSLSPSLGEAGVHLVWRTPHGRGNVEMIPLQPGRQTIAAREGPNVVLLECPASSAKTVEVGRLGHRLDARVTCSGTVDDFECVLQVGDETQSTRGGCYPPKASPVVSMEPRERDEEGTARLQVLMDASRPGNEQLNLEGGYENQRREARSRDGRLLHSVYERTVPAATTSLAALHVGRDKLLVSLTPGSVLVLRYDDCGRWALQSSWLDPRADTCELDLRACRPGYREAAKTTPSEIEPCRRLKTSSRPSGPVKRCVREGQFRVRASPGTQFTIQPGSDARGTLEVVPASGLTRYYPAVYQRCARDAIVTASDRAILAIGAAERWTITLRADGRVLRGVQEPSDDRERE